jgi:hypothetical protein
MDVSNGRKPSFYLPPLISMKELTLERNPIDVSYVGKPSHIPLSFKNMK